MHWEILIIPLIALGVWILGTLFRGEEDPSNKGTRRPGGPPRRTPRRPVTNLDRFLEEIRLRREGEEQRKAPPPPPRPTIARPPLSERPPRQREMPPRPARPSKRTEEVPVALPMARPVAPPVVLEAVLAAPPPPQPETKTPISAPPSPVVAAQRETRPAPILQQVYSLLSNPQTAGTAFVLREIFDRPLCLRRR